jgi:hypothetical protein
MSDAKLRSSQELAAAQEPALYQEPAIAQEPAVAQELTAEDAPPSSKVNGMSGLGSGGAPPSTETSVTPGGETLSARCFPTLPGRMWASGSSVPRIDPVFLLDRWVQNAKIEIKAAHVDIHSDSGSIRLEAPTYKTAAIALLESIRRVLRGDTTTALEYFNDLGPQDVANYVHVGSSYQMYVLLHDCIMWPANQV